MSDTNFEPHIISFLCTWWAYAAADLAGVSRLQYPPNNRVIRVMCTGSVSPHHMLRSFQQGVDGVFVGGWHKGECNYLYGNYSTEKRLTVLSQMLDFCGIDKQRLRGRSVSSAEGPEYVEEINDFVDVLKKLGPSPLKKEHAKTLA